MTLSFLYLEESTLPEANSSPPKIGLPSQKEIRSSSNHGNFQGFDCEFQGGSIWVFPKILVPQNGW